MTYPTTDSAQYYVERYSKLIDGRIVGLAVDDADDEVFLALRIRLPSGQILNAWIVEKKGTAAMFTKKGPKKTDPWDVIRR